MNNQVIKKARDNALNAGVIEYILMLIFGKTRIVIEDDFRTPVVISHWRGKDYFRYSGNR